MKRKLKGFTLVELVITIAIVIILSAVSVPIYRGYVNKAKLSEGYALLGTILSAQKAYYSEYGNFLSIQQTATKYCTNYEPILGIDARGNKYFTSFFISHAANSDNMKFLLFMYSPAPTDLRPKPSLNLLSLGYNITNGANFWFASGWSNPEENEEQ